MSHVVIYIPGLGDENIATRRFLVAGWRLYGVTPVVHQMNWSDGVTFKSKLTSLLARIDQLYRAGHTVSLVGESAGASAALNAYAVRAHSLHRVACICGKLKNAHTIGSATYHKNPAFAESMSMLNPSIDRLTPKQRARIVSVRPLRDKTVPVADTIVAGAHIKTIPSFGHVASIVLGDTIFSFVMLQFLKKRL